MQQHVRRLRSNKVAVAIGARPRKRAGKLVIGFMERALTQAGAAFEEQSVWEVAGDETPSEGGFPERTPGTIFFDRCYTPEAACETTAP